MSWKVEVQTDSTSKWYGNAIRYASKAAAELGGADLAFRWTLVGAWRVVESDDPANYDIVNGELVRLEVQS